MIRVTFHCYPTWRIEYDVDKETNLVVLPRTQRTIKCHVCGESMSFVEEDRAPWLVPATGKQCRRRIRQPVAGSLTNGKSFVLQHINCSTLQTLIDDSVSTDEEEAD